MWIGHRRQRKAFNSTQTIVRWPTFCWTHRKVNVVRPQLPPFKATSKRHGVLLRATLVHQNQLSRAPEKSPNIPNTVQFSGMVFQRYPARPDSFTVPLNELSHGVVLWSAMGVNGQSAHGRLLPRRSFNSLANGQVHEPTTTSRHHGVVAFREEAKGGLKSQRPHPQGHSHLVV